MNQTTIANTVSCHGIGIHSGQQVRLVIKAAPENTGIVFVRTDVKDVTNYIPASYKYVIDTNMSTAIENDSKIRINTIEHLMAAIWGQNIDNLIIELDGPEVPIMDGSSHYFSLLLEYAGIKFLSSPKKYLKLLKLVSVNFNDTSITALPSEQFSINMNIEFAHKAIGKQSLFFQDYRTFKKQLTNARTFGFLKDFPLMKDRGLAQGASLENTIALDEDGVINPEGLRFEDEFVRHKVLDSIGDFYLAEASLIAEVHCSKSGHNLNNQLLYKILADSNNYQLIT